MDIKEKIEQLEKKVDNNYNEILSNMNKLHNHEEKINKNTGALEILKTFKSDSNKFFAMWLITFIVLVG